MWTTVGRITRPAACVAKNEETAMANDAEGLFFIVSLDGGGVRGALQMRLLWRLCQRLSWLEQRIDMFAGTSAGALLAGGCAYRSLDDSLPLATEQNYRRVFQSSWRREAESADGWYEARYSNLPLRALLRQIIEPSARVSECHKKLLLTTFRVTPPATNQPPDSQQNSIRDVAQSDDKDPIIDAQRWRPAIVHNLDETGVDGEPNESLLDAMIRSASAPTYFPIHQGCVDGGIVATNPCMFAATYALRFKHVQSLDNLIVLSIGTGKTTENMASYGSEADLGRAQWLPNIVDMLMQANTEGATLQCHALLGSRRFRRLQVCLERNVTLDDADSVPYLLAVTDAVNLEPIARWLEGALAPPLQ